jgi:hypothetical protein
VLIGLQETSVSLKHNPTNERKSEDPFGYQLLTFDNVAERLHCARKTVKQSYRRWGLRPVRIAGKVLFPSTQLLELEERLIREGQQL